MNLSFQNDVNCQEQKEINLSKILEIQERLKYLNNINTFHFSHENEQHLLSEKINYEIASTFTKKIEFEVLKYGANEEESKIQICTQLSDEIFKILLNKTNNDKEAIIRLLNDETGDLFKMKMKVNEGHIKINIDVQMDIKNNFFEQQNIESLNESTTYEEHIQHSISDLFCLRSVNYLEIENKDPSKNLIKNHLNMAGFVVSDQHLSEKDSFHQFDFRNINKTRHKLNSKNQIMKSKDDISIQLGKREFF